jgi:hypothetical protein
MQISQMIDNASHAVTEIKVVKGKVLMDIMQSKEFTQEQKVMIVELLKPIDTAVSVAVSKFNSENQS